jgi:hypothetical protein
VNEFEFEKFAKKLVSYFGKDYLLQRDTNKDRFRAWFELVERIPIESLDWIRRQIQEDYDSLPTNLPKVMKHYYHMWLEKNPGKRSTIYANTAGHQNCPYCFGGLLEFRKSGGKNKAGKPYWYHVVARCGHCKSRTEPMIPMMSVNDGIHRGWIHIRPDPETKQANKGLSTGNMPPMGRAERLAENIGV